MRIVAKTLIAILSLALISCSDSDQSGLSKDPRAAMTPAGEQPLVVLDDDEQVSDTLAWAGMEIDEWRTMGVQMMIAALKDHLIARGIDVSSVEKIDDAHIGSPLPRLLETDDSEEGLGKKTSAITDDDAQKYFTCPINAPENNTGTACDDLVQSILMQVNNDIEQSQGEIEQVIESEYAELPDTSRQFIVAWALSAYQYGAQVAAIYAEHELRAANQCDEHANGETVSYILGTQQGISIVEELREWAFEQVKSCVINTDQIAERVRQISKSKVTQFMEEHRVCVTSDLSANNVALKEAEAKREEGIREGIDQRVEVLRQELFEERRLIGCCDDATVNEDVAPSDQSTCDVGADCDLVQSSNRIGWQEVKGNCVCCRRRRATGLLACKGPGQQPVYCGEGRDGALFCQCEAIPLGSPLVIDLDGDGLQLSSELVSFDLLATGEPQRSTWVGEGEALLAIDLDGDGAVGSSAELFGNRSSCGDHRCYDGPEALAQWDRSERGGNGDGMIDRRDAVFSRLLVWLDENHDGVSQAGELQPLAARGIVSLGLEVNYDVERRPEGAITSQLEVLTKDGFRGAYDVWFRLKLGTGELTDLLK